MPLLAGIGPLGPLELGLILLIVVLIFGAGKLSDVGGAIGKSVREFRKASRDEDDTSTPTASANGTSSSSAVTSATADMIFCGECGAKNPRSAKFCGSCGHAIAARVS